MTIKEKKYLSERINGIYERKASKVKEKFNTELKPDNFNNYSSYVIIKKMIKLLPKVTKTKIYEVVNKAFQEGDSNIRIIDFYDKEVVDKVLAENREYNKKLLEKEREVLAKLKSKKEEIEDQIFFGDSEEALALIKEFNDYNPENE